MFDAVLVKVFDLAARRRRDTPALRQFADTLRHSTHFIRRELAGVDAALLKIAVHFFVGIDVDEAEHKPRGVLRHLVTQPFDLRENVRDGEFVGQDQRIEPPDDTIFPQPFVQSLERFHALVKWWNARLDAFGVIVVERELEVVVRADGIKRIEMCEHWPWVLRPEHNTSHLLEAHVERHAIERIEPLHIPGFQSFHEPIGIESRNVSRTTRGDNDRHLGQYLRAVRDFDLLFPPRSHCVSLSYLLLG